MRFQRPNGGTIEFSEDALQVLSSFRQKDRNAAEAGGVLLGRLILDSSDVVIDEATRPGPLDRRSRYTFWRSRRTAQPRVEAAWRESQGTRNYLGGWHSHPEDDPRPSCVDRMDWRRTLKRAKYESGFLLFAIVGRERLRVWEAARGKHTLVELEEA